ncbi:MAG TPA: methyltransferase domain-containing protein [Acidimicrobiales bacterium]|nr:methyltransferase domain-containing protein [Acidimicrobiales bacterium]
MKKVDYDDWQHAVYVAGRQMSDEAQNAWMDAFGRHLPHVRPLRWLDLGSGTGRLTPALATAFGGPVSGVEPSHKMRAHALATARHPSVTYRAGTAEAIPLPDASCDAALLFYVWHHVVDRPRAVAELLRVVCPGGKLFVRTNLADRMPDVWWFRILPEWLEADRRMYRPQEDVINDFTTVGWRFESLDEVRWQRCANVTTEYERLKLRPTSLFEQLSDEEIAEGFARIELVLPSIEDGQPVYETSDLLVFAHP